VYAHLNGAGDRLRDRLRGLGERYRVPLQVTGMGSLFKIHFSETPVRDYRAARAASELTHSALFVFALNRGVFLSEGGRCCLSTAMDETEVGQYLAVVEEFLAALAR
jgi:glutamate-1-semialdehyde 2,1-aminomutase